MPVNTHSSNNNSVYVCVCVCVLQVDVHRTHVWRCSGPCVGTPPYFGLVKRAMNRPPGPTDWWWPKHQV